MTDVAILHLPFPPSTNAVTRARFNPRTGKPQFYSSKDKKDFYAAANKLCLVLKPPIGIIKGRFTYHAIFNEKFRDKKADGENLCKYTVDYAQHIGFIVNDNLAQGGSWQWGECEHGAMLSVFPFPRNINES